MNIVETFFLSPELVYTVRFKQPSDVSATSLKVAQ